MITKKLNELQTDLLMNIDNIASHLMLSQNQIIEIEINIQDCFLKIKEVLCRTREENKQVSLFEWMKGLTDAQKELIGGQNEGQILDARFRDGINRDAMGSAIHRATGASHRDGSKNSDRNQSIMEII